MPWLSLAFKEKATQENLTKGFQVQSIPTLVGVEADSGKIVTLTARNMVVTDPEGKNFPWSEVKKKKKNLYFSEC
ncbi:hypothetical protein AGDE_07878 [Angomonas deanei]|nr:hypothetical protein AGDE_07878 [Angomonas deanei]|eukprot:EPY34510.1 hypothetical protein AGDE_07878 [Angomonas deanei]